MRCCSERGGSSTGNIKILLALIPSAVEPVDKVLRKNWNPEEFIQYFKYTLLSIFFYIGNAPYTIERIETWFHPENDPQGGGWLGINRNLIIQSAQVFGEAEDMSNAITLFDEGTNYAFISILAHYGWIVAIGVVAVIILFSVKLIINSIQIKDLYGKLLTIGISSMFILQSIFNILMNLNLGMEANFNLPFVSYGGSSLVINMISLAIILSVYRKKDIIVILNNKNMSNTVEES